ncbi:helix-turn-helix domain-containing protein [Paenibacillus elgii]
MRRNWFQRQLLSYLPVFLAVAAALILLSVFSAGELARKEAVRANHVFAEHVLQLVDQTMRTVDRQLIKEIQTNEKLAKFYTNRESGRTALDLYETSGKLREIIVNTPFIDSIYLVRASDRTVLSPNLMAGIEQFGDREFIREALNGNGGSRWTDARSYREFNDQGEPVTVVSLVRKVPLLGGEKGIIVVNVRMSTIASAIKEMTESDVSFVRLLDGDRRTLASSEGDEAAVLTTVTSGYTGWTVESGLQGTRSAFAGFSYTSLWSLLHVGLVAAGAVWIVLVTRRNYRPIRSILERIDAYASQRNSAFAGSQGLPDQDEFRFIETALDDLVERTISYRKLHEEDLIFRKRNFFLELLEDGGTVTDERFQAEMRRFGMAERSTGLAMAVVEIDKYAGLCSRYSQRDQYLLKFALSSVIAEIAQQSGLSAWMEWTSNRELSVLLHLPPEAEDTGAAARMFENVKYWTNRHLSFTVTVGLGTLALRLDELPRSHAEALEALKYKSALGTDRIIDAASLRAKSQGGVYKHLQLLRSIAQRFRAGEAGWEAEMNRLFAELKEGVFSEDDASAVLHSLIYHLQREMTELPPEFGRLWNDDTLPELHRAMEQADTLDEWRESFAAILTASARRMEAMRTARANHTVMVQMKERIHEQYANPNLSLTFLGSELNVNPKYLSQMFKEEFGVNFLDYVSELRIGEAKRLLTETEETVQDIGARVGYPSVRSFLRVFKKATGVTPGEFRKK